MDLTDDQVLLRETTVRFIEAESPLTRVREWHDDPVGYDRSWLQKGAAIGWFAMLVPEANGGGSVSGRGLVDAALLAEQMGRHAQPGPFIPMNIAAVALADVPDVQAAVAAGDTVATWAFADERGNWDGGAGVTVDGGAVSGRRGFVQDAASADVLVVAGTGDRQGVVRADAPGVRIEPLEGLDLARRLCMVEFDGAPVEALVEVSPDALLQRAIALNCADTVGAMDALFDMTVSYAKDRVAFGRPIGSFQALKHLMADEAVFLETCKAGADAAVNAVQDEDPAAAEIVAMVAAYIGDVSNELAQECLQIHGGIGYTWEHDLHLLLRRIRVNSALYGDPTWHRERVCQYHAL